MEDYVAHDLKLTSQKIPMVVSMLWLTNIKCSIWIWWPYQKFSMCDVMQETETSHCLKNRTHLCSCLFFAWFVLFIFVCCFWLFCPIYILFCNFGKIFTYLFLGITSSCFMPLSLSILHVVNIKFRYCIWKKDFRLL